MAALESIVKLQEQKCAQLSNWHLPIGVTAIDEKDQSGFWRRKKLQIEDVNKVKHADNYWASKASGHTVPLNLIMVNGRDSPGRLENGWND